MKAKLGRATYVGDGGESGNGDVIPPDAGAVRVAAIVQVYMRDQIRWTLGRSHSLAK